MVERPGDALFLNHSIGYASGLYQAGLIVPRSPGTLGHSGVNRPPTSVLSLGLKIVRKYQLLGNSRHLAPSSAD